MHKRLFFQVQCGGWLPHLFSQTAQAHNLCNIATTACKHNANQKQIKPAGKIPQQKIMCKIFIYLEFFFFSPVVKECYAANASKPKALEYEAVETTGTTIQNTYKQAKERKQIQTIKEITRIFFFFFGKP